MIRLTPKNVDSIENRDPNTTIVMLLTGEEIEVDIMYLLYLAKNAIENAIDGIG